MFEDYMAHCKDSLDTYGDTIASTLASEQHFNTWLQDQKAEDIWRSKNKHSWRDFSFEKPWKGFTNKKST